MPTYEVSEENEGSENVMLTVLERLMDKVKDLYINEKKINLFG